MKYIYLHYDAPKQRSKNDGLLLGEKTEFIVPMANQLLSKFSLRVHEDTVTEKGLKIQLGGMFDDNSLQLTSIPSGFIGGKETRITVFGNAFPTHSIQGPFAN